MNTELKRLKDIRGESCITIAMNTHRTRPDNSKDEILLKNLIAEAEQRLLTDLDKRVAWKLIESMKKLADSVDHNHNLDSLILFISDGIAEFSKLPIAVEDRVVIDTTFATRDLVRAMHTESDYYILLIDQKHARLIEAFNDRVVSEITNGFPIDNAQMFHDKKTSPSDATRQRNLQLEFVNRVDKALNLVLNESPLPVLLYTQEVTYNQFLKMADKKSNILDIFITPKKIDADPRIIVEEAWAVLSDYKAELRNKRIEELKQSKGSGKFLKKIDEIWDALNQGRIQTLFIEEGLFQPGLIVDGKLELLSDSLRDIQMVTDDIYDEMIEINMRFGGDVVFLPKGDLSEYDGFAAIARF